MSKFDDMIDGLRKETEIPESVRAKYMDTLSNLPEKNGKKKEKRKRMVFSYVKAAVLAAVCFAFVGTTAYAAGHYFGIFDFLKGSSRELPIEAEKLVIENIVQEKEDITEESVADYTVKEATCDRESIYIVIEASAKKSGKYLFVPEDAMGEEAISNWGMDSDMSASEYAASKGLAMVRIGGGIVNTEELGVSSSSIYFRSVSDDVMDIMIESGKGEKGKTMEVVCAGTAVMEGAANMEDVMRSEIRFMLTDISESKVVDYVPADSGEIAGTDIKLTKVSAIQTTIGTYLEIYGEGTDNAPGLEFRIAGENRGKENGAEGMRQMESGEYVWKIRLEKIELGDTFTLEAYDCWEKTVYGEMELKIQ